MRAVTHTTGNGAPTASNGKTASCADPANTVIVISSAAGTDSPVFTIATPVTTPHTVIAADNGIIARTPSRYATRSAEATQVRRTAVICTASGWRPRSDAATGRRPDVTRTDPVERFDRACLG